MAWQALVAPISNLIEAHQDNKAREKEIQSAEHLKRLEGIQNSEASEFQADSERAKGLPDSWKDEFVLIILSIPLILCFIPGMDIYVTAGFKSLEETPNWFQYLFISVYSVSAGVPLANKTVGTFKSIMGK